MAKGLRSEGGITLKEKASRASRINRQGQRGEKVQGGITLNAKAPAASIIPEPSL